MCLFNKFFKMYLLFFIVVTVSGEYARVQKFDEGGGLHYEPVGRLGFVVNSWNFVLNIDYNELASRLDVIKNLTMSLKSNCSEANVNFENKLHNLHSLHDIIHYSLAHRKKRQRRELLGGAFNFVGRFNKYVYGTMDDEDAELLYDVVRHENNTEYRVVELSQQTLKIANYIEKVMQSEAVTCFEINRKINYLRDSMEDIESTYNKIINAIQMALNTNRVSPHIISPIQILEQMKKIDFVDLETQWVVKPDLKNVHTIMHIINCRVFLNSDNQIMFVMQIPRIDKITFNMYKVVPVPDCDGGNVCKFIVTQSQYIGYSDKMYVRLDDLNPCLTLDFMTLCYGSMTTKYISTTSDCDVQMLLHADKNKCEIKASKFYSEIFESLNNMNSWLYMVSSDTFVNVKCGEREDEQLLLSGTGILTALNYCKFKTSKSVLISNNVGKNTINSFNVVHYNFSNFYLPKHFDTNFIIKKLDYNSLSDVSKHLKKLTSIEETLRVRQQGDRSHADWYKNLFGNWWWELKFIIYATLFLIVLLAINRLRSCVGGGVTLSILKPL
uniref:PxGV-Corf26 protein n=1 Tax=Plutella xylostella granulovirus TaxID=98383 RepID=A0A142DWM1_9BBAC|nr:PxGV-Corf26 protein [Plutella xylostella granulovirus]AMQ35755.1 PxGV-Korf26 protein [Plutella xylostella granulovirus]AMQ35872.1 PxGV-Morf26 protein [Plutella xylostella granulovirus]AMQ35989.1 PxGV-Torf26 protein [Plutella xylostella granulovirus]